LFAQFLHRALKVSAVTAKWYEASISTLLLSDVRQRPKWNGKTLVDASR
jgi:hypothetical protein